MDYFVESTITLGIKYMLNYSIKLNYRRKRAVFNNYDFI